MRIISRFRDYYDAVMKSGMDKEVVYVRERKTIDLGKEPQLDFLTGHVHNYCSVDLVLLGYCGQFYKIVVAKAFDSRYVFHEFEEFKSFMLTNKLANEWDFNRSRWWPSKYQRFKEFDPAPLVELFHKFQTPLFTLSYEHNYRGVSKAKITLAPSLQDLEFYMVKDTYTAYQDIFQYVAGVLNSPENKMVKISDKDKIHKHGFDKWSFRKMPEKKK